MSSPEPPAGATPPPGEPTPPPPATASAPPPPPPPPSAAYGAPAPGAPALGVPRPAELLDRFVARLVDGILLGVVYGIIVAIVGGVVFSGYRSDAEVFVYYVIVSVLSSVLYLGYYAYLESTQGATVGKMVMKLKVVGPDGVSNPTMEQAVRRNIWMAFSILGIVPVLGTLLGALVALGAVIVIIIGINNDTARRQHWFDHFAGGTAVLKVG